MKAFQRTAALSAIVCSSAGTLLSSSLGGVLGFNLHPSTPSLSTKKDIFIRTIRNHHHNHGSLLPSSTTTQLYSTLEDNKQQQEQSSEEKEKKSFDPSDAFANNKNLLGNPIPYTDLTIGVLKESYPGENRVSVAPDSVKMLVDAGLSVVVESGGESFILSLDGVLQNFPPANVNLHIA